MLDETIEILKRIEIYVWNGQVNPAWRELGKARPYLAHFPEFSEITYRIGFELRDGKQVDAHNDVKRLHALLLSKSKQLAMAKLINNPSANNPSANNPSANNPSANNPLEDLPHAQV